MWIAHYYGARYPSRKWAQKVADSLNGEEWVNYIVRFNEDERYPDAPWEIVGVWRESVAPGESRALRDVRGA